MANVIKLFFFVTENEAQCARAFGIGMPFQPSLKFAGKIRALASEALLDRPGLEDFLATNTLAYLATTLLTEKSITLTTGVNVI